MPQKMAVMVSAIATVCALTLSAANSPVIGMVSSGAGQAGISIDGARVSGNATLFDGSVVEAGGYSRLELSSGARVDLGAGSVVRVFANHVSLEGGSSEVQSASHYAIDARSLKIEPSEAGSVARVRLDGDQRVMVTALVAPVNVWNHDGLLVARVLPAAPLSFLPQAAGSSAFSNSGCVVNKSGAAVFVDQTGNQVFELRSSVKSVDLRKFVGKRAAVTGTVDASAKPAQGATQVVNVSTIAPATGADCAPVATRIGATMSATGLAAGGAAAAGAGAAAGGAAAAGAGAAAGAAGAAGAAAGISGAVIGGVAAASAIAIGTTIGVAGGELQPVELTRLSHFSFYCEGSRIRLGAFFRVVPIITCTNTGNRRYNTNCDGYVAVKILSSHDRRTVPSSGKFLFSISLLEG